MPGGRFHVVAGEASQPAIAQLPRICKRPACPNPVPESDRQGRPAYFCGAKCRQLFAAERRQIATAAREALRLASQYEISLASLTESTPATQPRVMASGDLEYETQLEATDSATLLTESRAFRALVFRIVQMQSEMRSGVLDGREDALSVITAALDDAFAKTRGTER